MPARKRSNQATKSKAQDSEVAGGKKKKLEKPGWQFETLNSYLLCQPNFLVYIRLKKNHGMS